MIEIKNLYKKYDDITVVDNLSLNVGKGEVLGFLGPNGAGKSTTMKMVTGFIEPSSGAIKIKNLLVQESAYEIKKHMGYLPEGAPQYGEMTTLDFLLFIAKIRGIEKNKINESIESAIENLSLKDVLAKRIEHLSKGFKRRVGIAQAIIHDPEILIMDEPTDGLDPNQKYDVRELIKKISKDKTIIISTHILEEVEAVCTRAAIIAKGKLLFDDTPNKLKNSGENSLDDTFRKITLGENY
jgi:ABC-2 type transport system ATP-binding protein